MARCRRSLLIGMGLTIACSGACSGPRRIEDAPWLEPAPQVTVVSGDGRGAAVVESDIRVEARLDAWRHDPPTLDSIVTPIYVRIDNRSRRSLRVAYAVFSLTDWSPTGSRPLNPFESSAPADQRQWDPAYPSRGFRIAPGLASKYPNLAVAEARFPGSTYSSFEVLCPKGLLPNSAMLSRALPEGVLDPGGTVEGFVYFDRVVPSATELRFRLQLIDASNDTSIGQATIPFLASADRRSFLRKLLAHRGGAAGMPDSTVPAPRC